MRSTAAARSATDGSADRADASDRRGRHGGRRRRSASSARLTATRPPTARRGRRPGASGRRPGPAPPGPRPRRRSGRPEQAVGHPVGRWRRGRRTRSSNDPADRRSVGHVVMGTPASTLPAAERLTPVARLGGQDADDRPGGAVVREVVGLCERAAAGYLPAARRCQRVRFSIFLCFFLRMRLRRFLINEPMVAPT